MLKTLIIDLFGSYEPITYTDSSTLDIIPDGMSGVDWVWIAGVLLFAVTLYAVLRMIGGIIRK